MLLEPDRNEQGLWYNPKWTQGTPGVFALIIGVSRYRHLEGGEAPAAETYGLKQLPASALTAYSFFDWLRSGYTLSGLPVARVRLLLSPQKPGNGGAVDELADCDAAVCAAAPEATYQNCKTAIENWYAEMQKQPATAVAGRSLFFFSGHGMELRQMHQFLLPSDYLRPPTQPLNESIGTRNLIESLPYLTGVGSHVLFLDGCRNDVDKLRGRNVLGAPILNDALPSAVNPHYEQGVLSATASGLQAYSPTKAGSLSLFGKALLEGLCVKPDPELDEAPIEVRRKGTVNAIAVNPLASYIKGRIAALIRNANESIIQIVRADMSSDAGNPIDLTEVAPPPPQARPSTDATQGTGESTGGTRRGGEISFNELARPRSASGGRPKLSGTLSTEVPTRPKAPKKPVVPPSAWFDTRYEQLVSAPPPPPGGDDFNHLHGILGSEAITLPWMNSLQVTGLSSGARAHDWRAIEIKSAAQAHQMTQIHRVQLHVRVNTFDQIGHLVAITDLTGRRLGCVLPYDRSDDTLYQLEIDSEHAGGRFIRFAAYISPASPGPAGEVAVAWNRLRALDAVEAANWLDKGVLNEARRAEFVLSEKSQSPVGAAVATVLLLKGNQFDRLHDWPRNLANWFEWIPDGVALWTEQCRRMARGTDLEPSIAPWFVRELSRRSLPFTADAMGFAANIADDILNGRIKTDGDTQQAASTLAQRIDVVTPYFRDDGMLCAYAAWPDEWNLASMIGPRPPTTAPAGRPPRVSNAAKTGKKMSAKGKVSKRKMAKQKLAKPKAATKAAKKKAAAGRKASSKRKAAKRKSRR